jgi:hypothetical protein
MTRIRLDAWGVFNQKRTKRMKLKTSELIGPALDWAVAKCVGLGKLHYIDVVGRVSTLKTAVMVWSMELPGDGHGDKFSPSTDWAQGGPIIERECICTYAAGACSIAPKNPDYWEAEMLETDGVRTEYGPTPLVAAMRCYVASQLGDEVDVPDEVMEANGCEKCTSCGYVGSCG